MNVFTIKPEVVLNATLERRIVKDRQCDAFTRVLSFLSRLADLLSPLL